MANFYTSYYPNYFSVEDILASQDRVPCKFEVTVKGLGYLDASSGNEDILPGSKIELPCWMARPLCSSKRLPIVSAQLPVNYRERYRSWALISTSWDCTCCPSHLLRTDLVLLPC
ncbi:hypothetical protein HAZT_HAZT003098 [Hyalella azteca]|uniref:DNA replication complex GINS protein PSF3 n=1 Tax=Hyalella azteca TaxID=294128 RepID=A0A6A0H8L6_HYAAZ|nr:hypothetical protein HAZT_HAZT003098 [Hyalella azteca]